MYAYMKEMARFRKSKKKPLKPLGDLDPRFSRCVTEVNMMHKPKDETPTSADRKDNRDLAFSRCVKELNMLHNAKDETLTFVDDLEPVSSVKVQKTRYNPNNKTLTFVIRKENVERVSSVKELQKKYDPKDRTLTFVDRKDDLDPVSSDDGCLKAMISCGHAVTPESLTGWCRSMLDEGDYNFRCPALVNGTKRCDKPWSYQEVRRLADLSPLEMQYFESNIAHLAARAYCEAQPCPRCKTYVERTDLSNSCVSCTICAADDATASLFCWQCSKPWKGPATQRYCCGNPGCVNKDLQVLKSCRTISLPAVRDATVIPSIRACPTCGLKVEHNQQACKNVHCPGCRVYFCFICVKLESVCSQTSTPFQMCVGGVAPRQTSIPIWHKR